MKPFDVFLAVLVAVTWGVAFVASRLALDELSPSLMTAMQTSAGFIFGSVVFGLCWFS